MTQPAPAQSSTRYTSPEQVTLILAPSGDTAGTAADLPPDALQAEVDAAQDRVDAELAGRYGRHIPFDPAPAIIQRIARDIAAYQAELTYRGASRITFGDYDPIVMRYRAAVDLLGRLARGLAELAVPEIDEGTSSGGLAGAPRRRRGRLFTEETLLDGARRRVGPPDEPWWEW